MCTVVTERKRKCTECTFYRQIRTREGWLWYCMARTERDLNGCPLERSEYAVDRCGQDRHESGQGI